MKKFIRITIKMLLIWFLLMLGGMVNLIGAQLGALPIAIAYAGIGAAIIAIYKYKGKSESEVTAVKLNKGNA